jgi:hypothetical protein
MYENGSRWKNLNVVKITAEVDVALKEEDDFL